MRKTLSLSSGTRVRIANPGPVPHWSQWDDDKQRTSTPVKRRLQEAFFKGDKKIQAEVVYIANEDIRNRLRANGHVKVQLRDPAGSSIVITAETENLKAS